ncbi:metal ABC transporter substrate-binding protein [Vibrio sp. Of7-15]|uniref:metal ABC transporter substrate-binding protein n=1 Tax=Vibrio sp. Of7-15 TaxID=2724879 RepID=UPI001EF1C594|nr:metal ABC transporter substrate-binding protein [Vibrio sp. Of7-15]MCG7496599.1 metal ABC transporter substrate-binding protein [Vibrio sp. Of7-15]
MSRLLRISSAFLALSLFSFQAFAAQDGKFKLITTFTVIADMAQNVAGDAAIVESITKPNAEIHNYQPTPGDILRAQDADLIVYNGLNLELWFNKFFKNLQNVPSVIVTEGIEPMGITQGPYSGKPNPHAWMSAQDALIYVENIRKALVKYDPKNTDVYNQNAKQYSEEIVATVKPFRDMLASVPQEKRWLVTSEGAFSYMARDLGLQELYLWPINADAQGTPQQVRNVIDKVRAHKIEAVFSESTISASPAKQVARETGANYAGVLYVDSLSAENGPVPTYLDLLKVTMKTVAVGLSNQ